MIKKFDPVIRVKDDSLHIEEIGEWGENKYKIVGHYCNIFTNSMYKKWERLVYIDLFSGCGYSRITSSNKIIMGSPLISLRINRLFTDYIFIESDNAKYEALKVRINSMNIVGPKINIINGDSNEIFTEIIKLIPNNSLSFCFIDPYNINIKFEVIKNLASRFKIDFLILLASGMDAKRNFNVYLDNNNKKVERLLGSKDWRVDFSKNYELSNGDFIRFIADKFNENMIKLGYEEPKSFESIRSIMKNLPLYHLAFYSKSPLGNKFWEEVKKCSTEQYGLSFND